MDAGTFSELLELSGLFWFACSCIDGVALGSKLSGKLQIYDQMRILKMREFVAMCLLTSRPMPRFAPVTTATFPVIAILIKFSGFAALEGIYSVEATALELKKKEKATVTKQEESISLYKAPLNR